MSTAELHTLTGAYALHALEADERAEFERHLEVCPACAQEVAELAATTTRLGLAVAVTPPAELKARVLRRIATERQEPPKVTPESRGAGGGAGAARGRALSRFALAACLAAAAGFGGIAVWQHQEAQEAGERASASQQRAEALAAVLAAPDAKIRTGGLTDGATGTVVVSRAQDKAAFIASGMPKPPGGKVYQLWFNDDGTMRDAGLMDPSATSGSVLMAGSVGAASGMGITVEPAGGSPQPTSDPVALMNFPT
ncbi:anti-sigma factor domain-containing protein [Streptomyces niveus]|uniref:Regulator of SigK n=1 Tax=Streptomyces niveus TaxID=193462 RepID=A0A1U9QZ38_STRNV|nr:anti-sigma factor [Streptomyces niveus]AQU69538.1 anti-sigma factor [Streptomyces niveus]